MCGHKYTIEQDEFIKQNFARVGTCVQLFNEKFGTNLSYSAIKSHANRTLKIVSEFRFFTPERNDFLKETLLKHSYKETTEILNEKFGTNFTHKQIETHCTKCGIKREFFKTLNIIDTLIFENIDKPYDEIKEIIKERTGREYHSVTSVCVRANNKGLNRPHHVWSIKEFYVVNGKRITHNEHLRFVINRFHRLHPSLQPLALQVVRLQSEVAQKQINKT